MLYMFLTQLFLLNVLQGLFRPKREALRIGAPALRTGPADPTCGAACGALKHCAEGRFIPVPGQVFGDYQMDYIKTQVKRKKVV